MKLAPFAPAPLTDPVWKIEDGHFDALIAHADALASGKVSVHDTIGRRSPLPAFFSGFWTDFFASEWGWRNPCLPSSRRVNHVIVRIDDDPAQRPLIVLLDSYIDITNIVYDIADNWKAALPPEGLVLRGESVDAVTEIALGTAQATAEWAAVAGHPELAQAAARATEALEAVS